MRAPILVALLAAAGLAPAPADAQEGTCNARPRWLVVTVVSGMTESASGSVSEWNTTGARLVDRCRITSMFEISTDGPVKTEIHVRDSGGFHAIAIAESVHDICAAVDDCANATPQAPPGAVGAVKPDVLRKWRD